MSFYYCFAPDGETLEAVVAEVTNTPWGERHAYVLPASGDMDKALHVSPFMPMDQRYTCRAPAPGETLSVHIESRQDGRLAFDATLGDEAPAAHHALAAAPARADRPHARPHLRPWARPEAQGRPRPTPPRAMTETLARKIAMGILGRIHVGQLTVIEDDHETVFGSGAPQATVHIHSPKAWRQFLRGSRGMGTSYMDGLWDTPDLTAVIRVAARNVGRIDEVRRQLSPIREPFQRARAAFMRNTPQRSRKDIAAHYDLGNELFALMLDPTLMYSCGVFEHRDATLEEASLAKLEMVCEKLDLGPRDHVLEIGTGWGGFAVYAATTAAARSPRRRSPRSSTTSPSAASRRPASSTSSTSASTTTATSAAPTTSSSRWR